MSRPRSMRPGVFVAPIRRNQSISPTSSPNSPSPPTLFPLPTRRKESAAPLPLTTHISLLDLAEHPTRPSPSPSQQDVEDIDVEDNEDRQASQALNSTWPAIIPDNMEKQVTPISSPQVPAMSPPRASAASIGLIHGNDESLNSFNLLTQKTPEEFMIKSRADDEDSLTSLSSLSINDSPTPGAKRKRLLKTADNSSEQIGSSSDEEDSSPSQRKILKLNQNFKTMPQDRNDDADVEEDEDDAQVEYEISNRRFFGKNSFNITCLKQSLGKVSAIGNQQGLWPKKGPDTVKGRLQALGCERCRGWSGSMSPDTLTSRVHWACAGLEENEDYDEEEWQCPPCQSLRETQDVHEAGAIYCIRPDCILRAHKSVRMNEREKNLWLLRGIIGTKLIRSMEGKREFMYLVAWVEWQNCDATWEPAENIDHLDWHLTTFVGLAEREGTDPNAGPVVLLKEAQKDWDAEGKLKTARSAKWNKYGWEVTCGQLP